MSKEKKSPKRSTSRSDVKGVTWLTINGKEFAIITATAKKKFNVSESEIVMSLGNGKYVHSYSLSRDDLYKAAGYDTSKIDFAVPISWSRLPEIKKRYDKGDRAVWSYEKFKFGAPVWDSEAKRKLKVIILKRLAVRR